MVFLLILVFLVIIGLQVPPMIKKQEWRELAAFSGFLLIGMVLSFALVLGLPIPNPTKGIEAIFTPVAEAVKELLS